MRIEALRKYRDQNPNGYFSDLPPEVRFRAQRWLAYFVQRRARQGKQTPQWTLAILVGQAKRLALNPPSSAWGRSMLARRGGLAVQRQYRAESKQPTAKATRVRMLQQQRTKQQAPGQQAAKQQRSPSNRQPSVFFNLPLGC
jgi:hypothetical protein